MVDPRSRERAMHDLTKLLDQQDFDSIDEANSYLASLTSKGDIPRFEPETPLEKAQEVMYDAWEATNRRMRTKLAKKALKISPDCADAYVLLAEEMSSTLEEARAYYQAGVEAGERALGAEAFEQGAGEFWGAIETRPYMRALKGLAESEWRSGNYEEAVAHFRRMLMLNPNDNQGVRYLLLASLLEMGDTNATRILLRQYDGDTAASWAYGRALVTFLEKGNTRHSRARLQEAIRRNVFFPAFLLGVQPLPETLPEYVELGAESEGISCFIEQANAWMKHEESMDWMIEVVVAMGPPPR